MTKAINTVKCIDQLGFYRMANGDKCEVVHINEDSCCVFTRLGLYKRYTHTGIHNSNEPDTFIVGKWKDIEEITLPSIYFYRNSHGYIGIERSDVLAPYGSEIIFKIPALVIK